MLRPDQARLLARDPCSDAQKLSLAECTRKQVNSLPHVELPRFSIVVKSGYIGQRTGDLDRCVLCFNESAGRRSRSTALRWPDRAGLAGVAGVAQEDGRRRCGWLAEKVLNLRGFEDDHGKMNLSVVDVSGEHSGRQPVHAAGRLPLRPAAQLHRGRQATRRRGAVSRFTKLMEKSGLKVGTGVFGAMMKVELINDGPVTFLLDSRKP